MSTIQEDFDRIALVSEDGATHNEHYHNFLLRHLPPHCVNVLEIGCGTGGFARRLAERSDHVMAVDLSPEMIRIARERSTQFSNIEYVLADILDWLSRTDIPVCLPVPFSTLEAPFTASPSSASLPLSLSEASLLNESTLSAAVSIPAEGFDCLASIATLHHLPFPEMLAKMKSALKPGGVLLILDLFEPVRLFTPPGPRISGPATSGPLTAGPATAGPFTAGPFTAGPFTAGPFTAAPSKGSFKSPGSFQFAGLLDWLSNLVALPVSAALRLIHQGRLFPRREVRDAWAAHAHHDLYPTMSEVRTLCASLLPDAKITKHLLWRYSIVWKKPR